MLDLIAGRVMIFGTFDVFHEGHRFFIESSVRKGVQFFCGGNDRDSNLRIHPNAPNKIPSDNSDVIRKLGSVKLIIVVARDETVKRLKGILRNPEKIRQKVLQENFPEARVVLGDLKDPMKIVGKYKPGLICMGYDQDSFDHLLEKEFPEIEVKRIGAYMPEKYKSSIVMKRGKCSCHIKGVVSPRD